MADLDEQITVYLIGDSTCQTNGPSTYPQKGWGQTFKKYLRDDCRVINLAKNGRSTKSFMAEGRFEPVIKNIKKGDFLFIQFGHNDEKEDERHTDIPEYKKNLLFYAQAASERGAVPIILSPVVRRKFDGVLLEDTHKGYDRAAMEVAENSGILHVDVTLKTKEAVETLGPVKSEALYMVFPAGEYKQCPEGKTDNTHLRVKGAEMICKVLRDELKGTDAEKIFK